MALDSSAERLGFLDLTACGLDLTLRLEGKKLRLDLMNCHIKDARNISVTQYKLAEAGCTK